MSLTYGSLFSGAGGFDTGFDRAGMHCLWQCEIDKNARALLAKKWPTAKLHDDINTFNPDGFECPSVICFGSPCQDLSVAGLRAGIHDGARSNLFFRAAGIIRQFARRGLEFAIWEQVPGVFSSDAGRDFACVLRAMADCGAMDVAWRVLDAQWLGVAQRRERVFLVADFRGERAAQILALSQSLRGDSPPSREEAQSFARPIGSGSARGSGYRNDADTADNLIVGTLNPGAHPGSYNGQDAYNNLLVPEIADCLQERDSKGCDSNTKNGHLIPIAFSCKDYGGDAGDLSPTLRACPHDGSHANGGAPPAIAFHPTQDPIVSTDGSTHALGCGSKNGSSSCAVVHSLTANGFDASEDGTGRGTPLAPIKMAVRRLTPLECLRLMGWPDDHFDGLGFSDSTKYKMCGNGCVATVTEWIGKRIVKFANLRQEPDATRGRPRSIPEAVRDASLSPFK